MLLAGFKVRGRDGDGKRRIGIWDRGEREGKRRK